MTSIEELFTISLPTRISFLKNNSCNIRSRSFVSLCNDANDPSRLKLARKKRYFCLFTQCFQAVHVKSRELKLETHFSTALVIVAGLVCSRAKQVIRVVTSIICVCVCVFVKRAEAIKTNRIDCYAEKATTTKNQSLFGRYVTFCCFLTLLIRSRSWLFGARLCTCWHGIT